MKYYLIFFILILLGGLNLSCKQKEAAAVVENQFCGQSAWYTTLAKSENEDEVIMNLSNQFISNSSLQAYKDHNEIIAFAIDEALDLKKTQSGLFYKIISPGSEEKLDWGNRVSAHYKGFFLDGVSFDSSCKRNKPMEFYVGNMIDGWNEGLQLIGVGGKILLLIPSRLAYGKEGLKGPNDKLLVAPDKVLLFEVEILEKLK